MDPVSLYEYEKVAKQLVAHDRWEFIEAGAFDEQTVRRNRKAFDDITINPQFLVDVSNRDLSVEVLGQRISFPVMVAPAGSQRTIHPDGECATVKGAGMSRTLYALPTGSGRSLEEVAEASSGPLWFQLYHFDDEVTEHLVKRAKAAGFNAICLTVDTPVASPKERDVRNMYSPPRNLSWGSLRDHPEWIERRTVGIPDAADWMPPDFPGLTYERLAWLKGLTGLPLVVKGIRTVGDAKKCVQYGADAVIVSNHGGRQCDSTLSTIETLPAIASAVGGDIEVYLDSGVRRGTDVLKALALGARAVLVGRPLFWGLALGGANGVHNMLETLRVEFDRALAYVGCRKPSELSPANVNLPCQHCGR
jgi:isopentenyl diphosphate isomerase/L-lactate dehydrogenase-like FMN-dependent dehydrogenase